jgi:hypothetical protein
MFAHAKNRLCEGASASHALFRGRAAAGSFLLWKRVVTGMCIHAEVLALNIGAKCKAACIQNL